MGEGGDKNTNSGKYILQVSWEWSSQNSNEPSTTSTTTPAPTPSAYDLWYYQDDSNNVQGPYSSFTMLEWFRAGYFR